MKGILSFNGKNSSDFKYINDIESLNLIRHYNKAGDVECYELEVNDVAYQNISAETEFDLNVTYFYSDTRIDRSFDIWEDFIVELYNVPDTSRGSVNIEIDYSSKTISIKVDIDNSSIA